MDLFAVTITSIYLVKDQRDEKGNPVVEKIALKGESEISVGERLTGGRTVGITPEGIVLYDGRPHQKPEQVNIAHYGGKTSPIVALFLNEDEAITCFNSEELKPSDPMWEEKTKEALDSIGNNNSVLVVSYWSSNLSKFHFPK